MWLPNGEKILKIRLFVLTQCTNVIGTHTDTHRMMAKAALAQHHAAKLSLYNIETIKLHL